MYKVFSYNTPVFFDGLLEEYDKDEIKDRKEIMKTQRNYSKDGNLVIISKDVCDCVVLVGLQHFNHLYPNGDVIEGKGFNVVGVYHIYMKDMNKTTFGDKYEKFWNSIKMISDFVVKDNKVFKEGGFEETEGVCKKDGIEILVLQGQSDEKKMGDQSKTKMVKYFCKEKKINFILPKVHDDKDEDSSLDVRLDVDGKCLYACYTGNEREEERKIWKFFGDNYLRSKVLSMDKKMEDMDKKMEDMDKKMEEGFDDVDKKMEEGFEKLTNEISEINLYNLLCGKRKPTKKQTEDIEKDSDRLKKKSKNGICLIQ